MTINAYFSIDGQEDRQVQESDRFNELRYGDEIIIDKQPYIIVGIAGGFSEKVGSFRLRLLDPKKEFMMERESDCLVNFYTANAEQSKFGSQRLTWRTFDITDFLN